MAQSLTDANAGRGLGGVVAHLRFSLMNLLVLTTTGFILAGGPWMWAGFLTTFILMTAVDEWRGDDVTVRPIRFPRILDALLHLNLPLLLMMCVAYGWFLSPGDPLGLAALGLLAGLDLIAHREATTTVDLIGGAVSGGLACGMAGINVAHELVHRVDRPFDRVVGRWLLALNCDTTFMIEHIHGHHVHAATARDPATARRGEPLWRFFARSTITGNANAFRFERERLARKGRLAWGPANRALRGQAMSLAYALAWVAIAGLPGLAAFAFMAVSGKFYLEAINYIEHYGLVRVPGRPMEARHSWDSDRTVSGAILYNLTRHAGHHLHAGVPFWLRGAEDRAPRMPYGYGPMICAALVPPLWRRLTAPLIARWDAEMASDEERGLIARGGAA